MTVCKSVSEKGYAKINLHLDVTGTLDGGYHAVSTVMQSVSLYDTVTISDVCITEGKPNFTVSCNVEGVPTDERNLAVRAALLFCEEAGLALSAHIDIEKNIPMAAGMAGGSTDGAAVLRGLNRALGGRFSLDELCGMGARLGADVPFCIVGGAAYADGRGDLLHPFPSMPDCTLLVACEGEGVSTPWAYRLLDELYCGFADESVYSPKSTEALTCAVESGSIDLLAGAIYNIFEAPVLECRPVAAEVKRIMLNSGAVGAMMSGSGPSVFSMFSDADGAERALEALRAAGYKGYICKPVGKNT